MNRRLVSVFAFALLVAGGTSFMVYRLVMSHAGAPAPPVPTNKLLVAARDLQVGALIHDTDLAEIGWGGTVPLHALKTRQEIVGRGVVANIYQNEPISSDRLAPKGAGAGLASTIPIGMRAVALRVNEVVGLAGFVLPGMRVDVLVSGSPPTPGTNFRGTLSRTVLQNIEVLSAGQKIAKNVEGKPEEAQVVNLLVTPDQAEILSLASSETKVQLVLRNPLDTQEAVTHGTSVASLFGASDSATPVSFHVPVERKIPPAPPPSDMTIEVYSGGKRSEQKIDLPKENEQ